MCQIYRDGRDADASKLMAMLFSEDEDGKAQNVLDDIVSSTTQEVMRDYDLAVKLLAPGLDPDAPAQVVTRVTYAASQLAYSYEAGNLASMAATLVLEVKRLKDEIGQSGIRTELGEVKVDLQSWIKKADLQEKLDNAQDRLQTERTAASQRYGSLSRRLYAAENGREAARQEAASLRDQRDAEITLKEALRDRLDEANATIARLEAELTKTLDQ
jgi:hypothetical protein